MPGALMVCLRCGHVMAFDEQVRFRELTPQERNFVELDPRVRIIQAEHQRIYRQLFEDGDGGHREPRSKFCSA